MKKVKLLAILACLVMGFSVSAAACGSNDNGSSNNTASEQPSDTGVETPETYSVTFVVDGETVETCYYTAETPEIVEPAVPEKAGYTAAWEAYELTSGNITVNAVYTAIEYTVTFVGLEGVEPITFTVETMADVKFPELTQEDGYDIRWDKTEADLTLGDLTVNYVKEIKTYTVTFVGVDGVEPITYTATDIESVVFPAAPAVEGYTVSWDKSEADLTLADLTVTYVKVAIEYTITFVGVEGVAPITFTVETLGELVIPDAPAEDGYVTGWDKSIADVSLADATFTYFKMTEKEYYSRDIQGVAMASIIKPVWEGNEVVWDETENAYHLINNCTDEDDKRGFMIDAAYLEKVVAIGAKTISFSFKVDDVNAGSTIYRGAFPNWWGTPNVDFWQYDSKADYAHVSLDLTQLKKNEDGSLKSIFLLSTSCGMYLKNIQVWAPDYNNITTKDIEKGFMTNYAYNYVDWDETEGAWLFKNVSPNGDNSRAFLMDQEFYNVMKSVASRLTFKVKFVGDGYDPTPGADTSLYVSFASQSVANWDNWWGAHQSIAYEASTYKEVSVDFHADADRSLFFLCTSGSFYIKDIKILPKAETLVHTYELDGVNNGPTDVKADGLGAFTPSNYAIVNDAPEGVNGTAVKLSNVGLYQAGAVAFNDGFAGEITEDTYIKIRIYTQDTESASWQMWMYNIDYAGHGGSGAIDQVNIFTNGWVDVKVKAAPYLKDGKLTGFQFGFFGFSEGPLEAFYVDSITLVNNTAVSVIK